MATFIAKVEIPDDKQVDVELTIAKSLGYKDQLPDEKGEMIANHQTVTDYLTEQASDFLATWFKNTFASAKESQILIGYKDEIHIPITKAELQIQITK